MKIGRKNLLLIYILTNFLLATLGNFYLPVFQIIFLNEALKSYSFFYLIYFIVFVIVLPKKLFNWNWNELHFKLSNFAWIIIISFVWIAAFIISNHLVIETLFNRISIDFFILCILELVTVSFVEEFAFREIVFKKLTQFFTSKYSLLLSIILSSFLFSITHLPRLYTYYPSTFPDIGYMLFTFIIGACLCIIYYYTNNFPLIVLLHSFVNFDTIFLKPLHFKPFGVYEASICLTMLICLLVLVHYKMKRINFKKKLAFDIFAISLFFIIFYISINNGNIIEYHKNGDIKATIEDSYKTIFDLKGRRIAYGKYWNGKKVGNWVGYDTMGNIKFKYIYSGDLVLKMHFYKTGKIMDSLKLSKGLLEGIEKTWYENGNLKTFKQYKKGLRDNLCIWYFENGNIDTKCYFKNDVEEGYCISYYENTKKKIEGNYKHGKQDGLIIGYYESGIIESKVNWYNGKRNGKVLLYHPNGKIKIYETYKNDTVTFGRKYDYYGKLVGVID